MGKGYNHFDICSCRWCINHNYTKEKYKKHLIAFENKLEEFKHYFSITTPNAICSYCDAKIFFYQNSFGSRVFFDNLGKPWIKHHCYYEKTLNSVEEEKHLTLDNLPKLLKVSSQTNVSLYEVKPKIREQLLKGYSLIEFKYSETKKQAVIKYNKKEFGLCLYNLERNSLEIYIDDYEQYTFECNNYEKTKNELPDIFPYEIGGETTIEIFKEFVEKDKILVYHTLTIKNLSRKPNAYIKKETIRQETLEKLYKCDGLKIKVKSKLDKNNRIEFIEI